MSDVMLLGVLRMPMPDNPADMGGLEWAQVKDRMRQAADEIEKERAAVDGHIRLIEVLEDEVARLRAELAAEREELKFERHNHGEWLKIFDARTAERDAALASVAKLREALEQVLIGGNHIALLIGADHPPHTATHDEARKHYKTSQDTYEIWCCWRTMMHARAVLAETGGGDET